MRIILTETILSIKMQFVAIQNISNCERCLDQSFIESCPSHRTSLDKFVSFTKTLRIQKTKSVQRLRITICLCVRLINHINRSGPISYLKPTIILV